MSAHERGRCGGVGGSPASQHAAGRHLTLCVPLLATTLETPSLTSAQPLSYSHPQAPLPPSLPSPPHHYHRPPTMYVPNLLMTPPLSTTASAPTSTRSTLRQKKGGRGGGRMAQLNQQLCGSGSQGAGSATSPHGAQLCSPPADEQPGWRWARVQRFSADELRNKSSTRKPAGSALLLRVPHRSIT